MRECTHKNLVLIKVAENKLRCKHCHLTISAEELDEGYCPECYEESGKKRYDFETIEPASQEVTKYRCEDCGTIIEAEAT